MHGLVEREEGFFKRSVRIVTMALVKVDVIHLEPLQGMVQLFFNLSCRKTMFQIVTHGEEELRRDQMAIAWMRFESLPKNSLRLSSTILVGRVEEVDAVIQRCVDAPYSLLPFDATGDCEPSPEAQF